jgi:flagellar biosynthesis regulator FlbT
MKRLNWRTLNDIINSLTEEEVLALLNQEREISKRVSMLQRLHQRYTALRASRERIEILQEAIRP